MDYVSSRFCIYTYISLEKFDDEKLTEEFNNDFNLRQIWNKISIETKEKKKKIRTVFFWKPLEKLSSKYF